MTAVISAHDLGSRIMTGRLLLPFLMLAVAPAAHGRSGCPVPYQDVLARDGFTGLANCRDGGQVSAKVAGNIQTSTHTYAILDFRYRTAPIAGGVRHGGQRIVIIEDGRHFIGQYALSPPPLHTISIEGQSILIDVPEGHGNAIIFLKSGPPVYAYFDQDVVRFTR